MFILICVDIKYIGFKVLNRQEITPEERRGAEYDYIKNNGKAWLESASSDNLRLDFLSKHPRYPVLVKSKDMHKISNFLY